jgi:hypothetical protein
LVRGTGLVHGKSLALSLGAFDKALASGKLPVGHVTDRLVRATFSAIEKITPKMRIDNIPNPFPAPHNLSWYFGSCACPDDVRIFATMLGKGHLRVWSVAQDKGGWQVLVQAFGDTVSGSASTVEIETRVPSKRLKGYVLAGVENFKFKAANIDSFMHEHARTLLARHQDESSHFVQVTLARRYG